MSTAQSHRQLRVASQEPLRSEAPPRPPLHWLRTHWLEVAVALVHLFGIGLIVYPFRYVSEEMRVFRTQLHSTPELAVFSAILVFSLGIAFLSGTRSLYKLLWKAEARLRYLPRAIAYTLAFLLLAIVTPRIVKGYENQFGGWRLLKKEMHIAIRNRAGDARIEYVFHAKARSSPVQSFLFQIPVPPEGASPTSDDGELHEISIGPDTFYEVRLARAALAGEKRRFQILAEYPNFFTSPEDSVSLFIDAIYDAVTLEVTFPEERTPTRTELFLLAGKALTAIPGQHFESGVERRRFLYSRADTLFEPMPYGGALQLRWQW